MTPETYWAEWWATDHNLDVPVPDIERAAHRHEFDHDEITPPGYNGAVSVTEFCACGHAIQTYADWIL